MMRLGLNTENEERRQFDPLPAEQTLEMNMFMVCYD